MQKKVHARFKDIIKAAYLAKMASLSSINSVKYLFYVIDVFTKHAWVKPLTDKIAERFIRSLKNKIYKSYS